jgi:hypothetical protein
MSASVKMSCDARMPTWQYTVTSSDGSTPLSLYILVISAADLNAFVAGSSVSSHYTGTDDSM